MIPSGTSGRSTVRASLWRTATAAVVRMAENSRRRRIVSTAYRVAPCVLPLDRNRCSRRLRELPSLKFLISLPRGGCTGARTRHFRVARFHPEWQASARQLRASEHPRQADMSGLERRTSADAKQAESRSATGIPPVCAVRGGRTRTCNPRFWRLRHRRPCPHERACLRGFGRLTSAEVG